MLSLYYHIITPNGFASMDSHTCFVNFEKKYLFFYMKYLLVGGRPLCVRIPVVADHADDGQPEEVEATAVQPATG